MEKTKEKLISKTLGENISIVADTDDFVLISQTQEG